MNLSQNNPMHAFEIQYGERLLPYSGECCINFVEKTLNSPNL